MNCEDAEKKSPPNYRASADKCKRCGLCKHSRVMGTYCSAYKVYVRPGKVCDSFEDKPKMPEECKK